VAVGVVVMLVLFGLVFLGHKTSPTATASGDGATPIAEPEVSGSTYVDPNGLFTMETGPTWVSNQAVSGVPAWTIGSDSQGFADNVTTVAQTLPTSVSLDEVIEGETAGVGTMFNNVTVVSAEKITLANGQPAGLIILDNDMLASGTPIRQRQIVAVNGRHVVYVTVTTSAADADAVYGSVSTYVLTLDVR
jgi:hypothetical protein